MRILVTGCESSGTKMFAGILERAGADVNHHSPTYAEWDDSHIDSLNIFNAVVVVVRDTLPVSISLMHNAHIPLGGSDEAIEARARRMQKRAMRYIYDDMLWDFDGGRVYQVTYENYVGNGDQGKQRMCIFLEKLGLNSAIDLSDLGDANAKYYGGPHFHDDRESYERKTVNNP